MAEFSFARKLEPSRQTCPARKLKLRDCHLSLGVHKVQVWSDKIFVQDEFNRSLTELPLKEAEWIEVTLQELGGRKFLEFVAWDAPQGQGDVASKKWYVYEIQKEHAILRLEKLVQRRKKVDEKRFHYDRLEKFGLSAEKAKPGYKVKWSVAREKGYIE